jgi:ubiquinone biosynthesis protein
MDMFERKALTALLADTWLKMIYEHGFFHADPHPANILVREDGHISLIDFGIAGRLTEKDRFNLLELFMDVLDEKIERVPRRLESLGVEFPREKEAEFIAEARDVFTKYYGSTLQDIDPVAVLRDIFGVIYRLQLKLPTQYLLLEKTAATLEGIGSQMYPDFNIFEFADPYIRDFLRRRYSPGALLEEGSSQIQGYARMLREFPSQISDALEQVRRGDVSVNFVHRNLEEVLHRFSIMTNRLVLAVIYGSIILGSSIIGLSTEGGPRLLGISIFALLGFTASIFLALALVVSILRSGRH